MKTLITTVGLVLGLGFGAFANGTTNEVASADSGKTTPFAIEITLGGGGATTINGESTFGVDFSVSTNPFKNLPDIWVGIAQGAYWEPTFAGSTDFFVDYAIRIYKEDLYLNLGWSGGIVYDTESSFWRTGPEATFQYYFTDAAYLYVGANYDFNLDSKVEDGIRYGFGFGLHF